MAMAGETHGKVVFVGDEVTALGFRLAGVETRVVREGELEPALAQARQDAAVLIVTPEIATRMGATPKEGIVLVVSSVRGEVVLPDFALRLRRELGISP